MSLALGMMVEPVSGKRRIIASIAMPVPDFRLLLRARRPLSTPPEPRFVVPGALRPIRRA